MNRRFFVKMLSLLTAKLKLIPPKFSPKNKDKLSGFIISDAHIGWRNKTQPSVDLQGKLIDKIVNTFPDLDFGVDTGDIHHGYLTEEERYVARSQWVNQIANKFLKTPFFYLPGNHELGKGHFDPEIVAGIVGGHTQRPYYSFDIKGVHFIALPQLVDTIYISKESINWLELDLAINANKTTIIFSHNSLKGTTFDNGETGYRVVSNSESIFKLINRYPNVKAWFHGHNHHYQIFDHGQVVHVSNGRIGGFNPPNSWGPFGQGHLGGIYFEISKTELTIKCYSASEGAFLDELGFPHLSLKKAITTTFNKYEEAHHYYGHGSVIDGMSMNLRSHFVGKPLDQIHYKKVSNHINENNQFNLETSYSFSGRPFNKVIGFSIFPKSVTFSKTNKGIKLFSGENSQIKISSPVSKRNEKLGYVRGSYYRFSQLVNHKVSIKLNVNSDPSIAIGLVMEIFTGNYKKLKTISKPPKMINKSFKVVESFITKEILKTDCDEPLYFRIIANFIVKPNTTLNIESFLITGTDSTTKPESIAIISNKKLRRVQLSQTSSETIKAQILAHSAILMPQLSDNNLLSLLIHKSNLKWQIRNATSYEKDNKLYIKKTNNELFHTDDIIIAPFIDTPHYIYKISGCIGLSIVYKNNMTSISVSNTSTNTLIYIYSKYSITSVIGGQIIETNGLHFKIKQDKSIMTIHYENYTK